MEPILSVENLSISFCRYGRGLSRVELTAIWGASLTVEPGQVVAVVGASGGGKSLLSTSCPGTPKCQDTFSMPANR